MRTRDANGHGGVKYFQARWNTIVVEEWITGEDKTCSMLLPILPSINRMESGGQNDEAAVNLPSIVEFSNVGEFDSYPCVTLSMTHLMLLSSTVDFIG